MTSFNQNSLPLVNPTGYDIENNLIRSAEIEILDTDD